MNDKFEEGGNAWKMYRKDLEIPWDVSKLSTFYSTDWDGPTPSSTLYQKQLLKRPWYSDNITEQLELPPLSTRRKIARITLLHKAIHEKVAIPIPSYIIKPTRTSRFHHPKRYIQIRPKKDVYKYSFFPRTIRDWNLLSDELLDIESSESRLTKLYYGGWITWTKDFILILVTCKYQWKKLPLAKSEKRTHSASTFV